MQAKDRYGRRTGIALVVLLLGALITVPSSVAQGGAVADSGPRASTQRFLALRTTAKPTDLVLLGFGPIHDRGLLSPVSLHEDAFRFPSGSLLVRYHRVARIDAHDPVTCLFTFRERGTYQVVRGHGDYVGAPGTDTTCCKARSSAAGTSLRTPPISTSRRTVRTALGSGGMFTPMGAAWVLRPPAMGVPLKERHSPPVSTDLTKERAAAGCVSLRP
jgi:hypothetical protein